MTATATAASTRIPRTPRQRSLDSIRSSRRQTIASPPQNGEQYQYDAAGNLTLGRDGETYAFDAENRMTAFNGGASQGGALYAKDMDDHAHAESRRPTQDEKQFHRNSEKLLSAAGTPGKS